MKKSILIILFLFFLISYHVHGQNEKNHFFEITYSNSVIFGEITNQFTENKEKYIEIHPAPAFRYGFQYGFFINDNFSVSSAMMWSKQTGYFSYHNELEQYQQLELEFFSTRFEIPIILNYQIRGNKKVYPCFSGGFSLYGYTDQSMSMKSPDYTLRVYWANDIKLILSPTLKISSIWSFNENNYLKFSLISAFNSKRNKVMKGHFITIQDFNWINLAELCYYAGFYGFEISFGFLK